MTAFAADLTGVRHWFGPNQSAALKSVVNVTIDEAAKFRFEGEGLTSKFKREFGLLLTI